MLVGCDVKYVVIVVVICRIFSCVVGVILWFILMIFWVVNGD